MEQYPLLSIIFYRIFQAMFAIAHILAIGSCLMRSGYIYYYVVAHAYYIINKKALYCHLIDTRNEPSVIHDIFV